MPKKDDKLLVAGRNFFVIIVVYICRDNYLDFKCTKSKALMQYSKPAIAMGDSEKHRK